MKEYIVQAKTKVYDALGALIELKGQADAAKQLVYFGEEDRVSVDDCIEVLDKLTRKMYANTDLQTKHAKKHLEETCLSDIMCLEICKLLGAYTEREQIPIIRSCVRNALTLDEVVNKLLIRVCSRYGQTKAYTKISTLPHTPDISVQLIINETLNRLR